MHAADLAALHAACFGAVGAHGWGQDDFARALAAPEMVVRAEPRGFALARCVADEAELILLATHPKGRRSGVATALLAQLERQLRDQGAARLFLEVASDNAAARAFYAASGFAQVGARQHYYGPGRHAELLEKALKT